MALYNKNIETLGTTTYNETYEIKNDVDVRDFNEPCNIFVQNIHNDICYNMRPSGCYRHEVLYNLSIPDYAYFHNMFLNYCADAKGMHTDLMNGKKLDSYRFVLDVMNHFNDCPEVQGFIDAYLQKNKYLAKEILKFK